MARNNESLPKTHTPENEPYIVEYAGLVEAVQLSVARLIDIPGAITARSFSEILNKRNPTEREQLICEVGGKFDQQLILFVTSTLINQGKRPVVIMASESEGINGHLPWESALESHLARCRESGFLVNASVEVERYSTSDEEIEKLTYEAQKLAA